MTTLENLAFAESALLHANPQSTSSWIAIEFIRRARAQLVQEALAVHPVVLT